MPPEPKPVPSLDPKAPGSYRIRPGDTMGIVARRFGTTSAILMGLNTNRIEHPSVLEIGDVIRVPKKSKLRKKRRRRRRGRRRISKRRGRRRSSLKRKSRRRARRRRRRVKYRPYRVRRGDTLSKIARRLKTSPKTLMRINRGTIEHPSFLEVGTKIRIPTRRAKKRVRKKRRKGRSRRRRATRNSRKRRTAKRNLRNRQTTRRKPAPRKRTSKKKPGSRQDTLSTRK